MGNVGVIIAAVVGVLLAGVTVATAVNISQPNTAGDAEKVSQEELVDYDAF